MTRLWLVGGGNMGGAMLRRWVIAGIDPTGITVIDPGMPSVPEGVRLMAEPPRNVADHKVDVLVLAVKPQHLRAVADGRLRAVAPRLLLSILAGVETAALEKFWRTDAVVRAMPNLPVAIGKGVTALYTSGDDLEARATAEALAAPLGRIEWIDEESLFDAVSALSGCGPGFVFRFIDALAAAGARLGLSAEQAARLAAATVEGAAAMAASSRESPAMLADRVASPGGSTREGLNVLDRDEAMLRLLENTLAASAHRNAELAVLAD